MQINSITDKILCKFEKLIMYLRMPTPDVFVNGLFGMVLHAIFLSICQQENELYVILVRSCELLNSTLNNDSFDHMNVTFYKIHRKIFILINLNRIAKCNFPVKRTFIYFGFLDGSIVIRLLPVQYTVYTNV